MKYPIYDGVQGNQFPIGYVELPESITGALIQNAYLLPLLVREDLEIVSFALVQTPAVPT